MYFTLSVGVLCLFLFCYALLCVHSNFAIILKRKLVALLFLSYRCIVYVNVLWLFLTVPWVGLQCVIVVFPDHTNLPFGDSYPVAYHSTYTTNISNVPLKKLLSHSATKGEFTVFLSKELLEFSNENKLYTVAWQNKADTSHRDGMLTISAEVKKKLILHAVDARQNCAKELTFFSLDTDIFVL